MRLSDEERVALLGAGPRSRMTIRTAAFRRAWDANIDLSRYAPPSAARLVDVASIEQAVRQRLPLAAKLPRDMQERAGPVGRLAGRVIERQATTRAATSSPSGLIREGRVLSRGPAAKGSADTESLAQAG